MAQSIYTYVKKFPEIESIISKQDITQGGTDENECKSFKQTELMEYSDPKNSFIESCTRIAKHHKKIIKEAETSEIALCKYINYWIYGTLKSMPKFCHKVLLKQFYGKVKSLEFCKTHRNPIDETTYGALKELSTLYKSFIKFKQESTQDGTISCAEADNFIQLYETSAGKCISNYNNYVCWELIKIRAEYEQNRAFAKGCKNQMIYLTQIGNDILPTILFPFVVMSLISLVFMFLYNFTSFDTWLRSKLPGAKKKTNKLVHKIHVLQKTSEMEGRRYKLPYHSS